MAASLRIRLNPLECCHSDREAEESAIYQPLTRRQPPQIPHGKRRRSE
jgi:hypothetical protein